MLLSACNVSKIAYLSLFLCLFLFQVWIVGEKVGEGIGRTRKEAQYQAAEISLRNLAGKFVLHAWATQLSSFVCVHIT